MKLFKNAKHEYSPNERIAALIVIAPLFLFGLPYMFITLGSWLDQWLHLPPILGEPLNLVFGLLLIVLGLLFAWWAIYSQFTLGKGTPAPLMATQKLIVQPPFSYCRNPMALGTIVAFLGVAALFHSIGAALLVLLCAGALLIYIKRHEEKEMELQFGQEYLAYKQRTPFLIPRFRKRP